MQKRSALENCVCQMMCQNHDAEFLGMVAYHGGIPQVPNLCYLNLGLVKKAGLVIYHEDTYLCTLDFNNWINIEKFTTLAKVDHLGKMTVLLGPLVSFFDKVKERYYITIKHIDVDREENHVLFEMSCKELQQEVYEKIVPCYLAGKQLNKNSLNR